MPDELTTLDATPQTIEVRSVERREIAGRIFPYNVTIRVRGRRSVSPAAASPASTGPELAFSATTIPASRSAA
jgi:hypothetical protein